MRRQQYVNQKDDLFESGKAYRNSYFGPDSPPPSGPPQGGGYPGFGSGPEAGGGGFSGYSGYSQDGSSGAGGNLPVPFGGGQQQPQAPGSSLLGNLPIKDIKAFVDRMGGIEGIMNTITKMNALMKNVQQMAPMIKLLAASFLKKGASDTPSGSTAGSRKRRKRKRTSSSGRRPSQSNSRKSSNRKPVKRKSAKRRPVKRR